MPASTDVNTLSVKMIKDQQEARVSDWPEVGLIWDFIRSDYLKLC